MSDKHDKTEKAAPKRREDAKKKGQIARGAELPAAFALAAAILAASAFGEDIFFNFGLYFQSHSHKITNPVPFTSTELHLLFIEAIKYLAIFVTPIVAISLVAGLTGNFAQGGFAISTEKFKPKADNFNPAKNIKKIFGLDSVVNLAKSSFKLVALTYVVYGVLAPMVEKAPAMLNAPVPTIAIDLGSTLLSLSFRCAMVMLLFACANYGYSIYKHEKSL